MLPAVTFSVTSLTVLLLPTCGIAASPDGSLLLELQKQTCPTNPRSPNIGDRALCPYTEILDVKKNRIPPIIPTVNCSCPNSRCYPIGDFRCQEVG
ncbi:hypothetical protein MTO96_018831 [Rhipicephalus appendiculatus]